MMGVNLEMGQGYFAQWSICTFISNLQERLSMQYRYFPIWGVHVLLHPQGKADVLLDLCAVCETEFDNEADEDMTSFSYWLNCQG